MEKVEHTLYEECGGHVRLCATMSLIINNHRRILLIKENVGQGYKARRCYCSCSWGWCYKAVTSFEAKLILN